MKVTGEGQVTIPHELRERFGLTPGTEVEVTAGEDGAVIRPASSTGRGARLVASLRDQADGDLSADAVLALTRGG